jgi:hypothetical protein
VIQAKQASSSRATQTADKVFDLKVPGLTAVLAEGYGTGQLQEGFERFLGRGCKHSRSRTRTRPARDFGQQQRQ